MQLYWRRKEFLWGWRLISALWWSTRDCVKKIRLLFCFFSLFFFVYVMFFTTQRINAQMRFFHNNVLFFNVKSLTLTSLFQAKFSILNLKYFSWYEYFRDDGFREKITLSIYKQPFYWYNFSLLVNLKVWRV